MFDLDYNWLGENEHLPLSPKLSNKMSMFWNYLAKYPYFKLDFLKIEFQWKTRFLENLVMWNQTLKKKKNVELEFYVKFLTLLDFHQIEFQNRGILQDSFKTWGIFATSFGQKRQMLILATEFVLIV